jgi:hypothetical protein
MRRVVILLPHLGIPTFNRIFKYMKRKKSYSELDKLSRKAMRNQRISHRIEGIKISKSEAEKIRKEVLEEYVKSTALSKS